MCYLSLLVVVLLATMPLNAFKLNEEENQELQNTCGTEMKEVYRYARKVLNGTIARTSESPWTVAVYINDHLDNIVYTTGALISNRHIISYDRLFLVNTTEGVSLRHNLAQVSEKNVKCIGNDLVLPKDLLRQVSVYLNMLRADRFSGNDPLSVSSVRILNGCEKPFQFNKVAIITLKKPVTEQQKAKPICFGSDFHSNIQYTFYGYGDNRGKVMDATLRHTSLTEVPCEYPTEDVFCVKSEENLCNGDFGGTAIKKLDGSIRAFGVYVDGPFDCSKADEKTVYKFANMSTLAGKVCDVYGICPSYASDNGGTTESTEYLTTSDKPQADFGLTTASGYKNQSVSSVDSITELTVPQNGRMCINAEGDDIHIHIRLGKYRKTRNENDIEIIREKERF